jgi:dipeptidyl aminopeptidase/acylaminoacyl peptidase
MRRLLLVVGLALSLTTPSVAATPDLRGHLVWQDFYAYLHVAGADGRGSAVVPLPPHYSLGGICVDRSGTRIAFTLTRDSDTALPELWVAEGNGRRAHQVVGAVLPSAPSWSPDGRRLVYISEDASLRVIGADGRDDHLVLAVPGFIADPQWAPRGSSVVYAHNVDFTTVGVALEIVDVDAPVPVPRVLARHPQWTFAPRWSPNGNAVSYLHPDGLYVVDVASAQSRRLAPGGDPSVAGGAPWSPDGRALLLCRPVAGGFFGGRRGDPLKEIDSRSGHERTVGRGACLSPIWSPDGRHTAVVDLSNGPNGSTHLVVRDRRGTVLRDLGEAWGVGVVWSRI